MSSTESVLLLFLSCDGWVAETESEEAPEGRGPLEEAEDDGSGDLDLDLDQA